MRRFTFYILVAVLAFGVGSLITLNFYFQNDAGEITNESINSEEHSDAIPEFSDVSSNKDNKEIYPVCTNKVVLSLWKDLKTDKKYEKWKEVFEDESNCLEKMFKVETFDLNADGKNEFLVRGNDIEFCGATCNCDFWIYRKSGEKYYKILSGYSYLDNRNIFSQIEKSRNNKYKDILLEVRVQRNAHAYRLYKFDGKQYRERKCSINQWNELKPEEKIKTMTCREFEKRNYKIFDEFK